MTIPELVEDLRARGVTLEPRGDRLAVRPTSRLSPGELETLRRHKPEVLRLLAPAEPWPPALDPVTVRETFGRRPDPAAVATVEAEVAAAVQQAETEIQTGALGSGVLLVHGRPLADWLDLDTVARLLRSVPWRS